MSDGKKLLRLRGLVRQTGIALNGECSSDYETFFDGEGIRPSFQVIHLLTCSYCLSRWYEVNSEEAYAKKITLGPKELKIIFEKAIDKAIALGIHETQGFSEKSYRQRAERLKLFLRDREIQVYPGRKILSIHDNAAILDKPLKWEFGDFKVSFSGHRRRSYRIITPSKMINFSTRDHPTSYSVIRELKQEWNGGYSVDECCFMLDAGPLPHHAYKYASFGKDHVYLELTAPTDDYYNYNPLKTYGVIGYPKKKG
jgi:hypothetical protein